MASPETLPGLNEDESIRLRSQAELGLQFDDEMRNWVIRLIAACPSATSQPAPSRPKKKRTKTS